MGVQPHHGLVKNDQLWAMNQPTTDGQFLLHSFGEVTAQLIPFVCQFKAFQEPLAIPVVLYAVGPPDKLQML